MAASTYEVRLEVDARRARRWVQLMRFIAPVVGAQRAYRWAAAGAIRLIRHRTVRP